jgi:hypothetical protein
MQAAHGLEAGGAADETPADRLARVRAELAPRLEQVNRLAGQLVRENAAPGLRGDGPGSAGHRAYIASFVDII